MGCHSSCYITQRITNALKFILQNDGVDCKNYLDDLRGAEVPDLSNDAFKKMGNLLTSLKIEESVSKACKPSTGMIFLGIIIDTVKMTLELDINRLQEINNLLRKWEIRHTPS